MPVRTGETFWQGTNTEGKGKIKFGNPPYEGDYTRASRFEEASGTNPEELLAAAHSACFSLALAGQLTRASFPPESIHTTAQVTIEKVAEGFKITRIVLKTEAKVSGIDQKVFAEIAEKAKATCPVSIALAGVDEIALDARLL